MAHIRKKIFGCKYYKLNVPRLFEKTIVLLEFHSRVHFDNFSKLLNFPPLLFIPALIQIFNNIVFMLILNKNTSYIFRTLNSEAKLSNSHLLTVHRLSDHPHITAQHLHTTKTYVNEAFLFLPPAAPSAWCISTRFDETEADWLAWPYWCRVEEHELLEDV